MVADCHKECVQCLAVDRKFWFCARCNGKGVTTLISRCMSPIRPRSLGLLESHKVFNYRRFNAKKHFMVPLGKKYRVLVDNMDPFVCTECDHFIGFRHPINVCPSAGKTVVKNHKHRTLKVFVPGQICITTHSVVYNILFQHALIHMEHPEYRVVDGKRVFVARLLDAPDAPVLGEVPADADEVPGEARTLCITGFRGSTDNSRLRTHFSNLEILFIRRDGIKDAVAVYITVAAESVLHALQFHGSVVDGSRIQVVEVKEEVQV